MRLLLAAICLITFYGTTNAQILKPGDTLEISVLQDPKLDRRITIDPSGQIAFPTAGRIRAAGSTPLAVENVIKAKLKPNYRDEALDVTVSLAVVGKPEPIEEDLKPKIFLTGEIARPGSYVARRKTNVVQAISLAGGLTPFAAKQRIQVRRRINGADILIPFNYRIYEAGLDLESNLDLRTGDIVIVPERGLFE